MEIKDFKALIQNAFDVYYSYTSIEGNDKDGKKANELAKTIYARCGVFDDRVTYSIYVDWLGDNIDNLFIFLNEINEKDINKYELFTKIIATLTLNYPLRYDIKKIYNEYREFIDLHLTNKFLSSKTNVIGTLDYSVFEEYLFKHYKDFTIDEMYNEKSHKIISEINTYSDVKKIFDMYGLNDSIDEADIEWYDKILYDIVINITKIRFKRDIDEILFRLIKLLYKYNAQKLKSIYVEKLIDFVNKIIDKNAKKLDSISDDMNEIYNEAYSYIKSKNSCKITKVLKYNKTINNKAVVIFNIFLNISNVSDYFKKKTKNDMDCIRDEIKLVRKNMNNILNEDNLVLKNVANKVSDDFDESLDYEGYYNKLMESIKKDEPTPIELRKLWEANKIKSLMIKKELMKNMKKPIIDDRLKTYENTDMTNTNEFGAQNQSTSKEVEWKYTND